MSDSWRRRRTSSLAMSSSTTARWPSTALALASRAATCLGSAAISSRRRLASTSWPCSTISFSRSGCIVILSFHFFRGGLLLQRGDVPHETPYPVLHSNSEGWEYERSQENRAIFYYRTL